MTALAQYARLECPGLWRAEPGAQRIEAIVSFGDASLVIADPAGRALSHWSLAAVERINPGEMPALYTPAAEAAEVLELAEDTMVEAIERVRSAVIRARPRGGRLRALLTAAALLAAAGAMALWLPGALVRHTVAALPASASAEIGNEMLAALTRVSGAPCRSARGDGALRLLSARLQPPGARLRVMPGGSVAGAVALPGGAVLLSRALVEDHETPEVLAGHVLVARSGAEETPPLATLLSQAGPIATLQLLTRGYLPEKTYDRWAERQKTGASDARSAGSTDRVLSAFADAGVSTEPYAYALDVTGETVLPLIEGDPMRGQTPTPLLPDGDWVALQNICAP